MASVVIGIDLGGTFIKAALVDCGEGFGPDEKAYRGRYGERASRR